ncbi:conserved hypothetical protein [Tenacibaculum dicentrarchi]|nr:conserved hypothetical protein [Tenacibaculum dicentrarchi]
MCKRKRASCYASRWFYRRTLGRTSREKRNASSNKNVGIINLKDKKMEFKRRFGSRKRTESKKGLFLIVVLIIVLYLFFNADNFLEKIL